MNGAQKECEPNAIVVSAGERTDKWFVYIQDPGWFYRAISIVFRCHRLQSSLQASIKRTPLKAEREAHCQGEYIVSGLVRVEPCEDCSPLTEFL